MDLQADEQQILECQMKSQASSLIHERRSANYKPNIWKYGFLESLNSKYDGDDYTRQFEKLIEDVKNLMMFVETKDLIAQLELIDSIGKLGLTNHFEKEIKEELDIIASIENNGSYMTENLYATALHFKILRQQGYKVSQDVFGCFLDEKGMLEKSHFSDVKGMLELLEASNLALDGENILDEAKASSTVALKDSNICNILDNNLARHVVHALKLSSDRRVGWFNVKWHIHAYEKDNHVKTVLLELAKLNFNMWADFCKALLLKAEWYSSGYTPSLEEYLSNGCISSSASVLLVHTFFSTTHRDQLTEEIANFWHKNEDFVNNVSLIVRLNNDLATSRAEQERGDAPSAILCYMREMNASEDIAVAKIKGMIDNAWKKINGKRLRTPQQVAFLSPFINIATNVARMAHSLYQDGDGFGDQEKGSRLIQSLLAEPLLL
ncbi:(E E)-alpha-farnesene synthase isoform X2 [Prunus yedoensis var. nudiflora]|uniref:(E E)-alpha-farnesene synthase isoform X2 n=1 Tax=Prunus yedoensis var. nudiflora TaxID=2094558 RepID=A0A314ZTQ1_PRUYE|nr:(E E)-alpha-farnesene synthase isoform X2 [Prunus yedoensis var. nudiflora]